jgi:hypothetical protein
MRRRVALSIVLLTGLVAAADAPAQQNPFVGGWRGVANVSGTQVTVELLMGADLRYSEQQMLVQHPAMPPLVTMQTGRYGFPNQNVVAFQVEDWQPRTRSVYHPRGTVGGYYSQEPVARPPGGVFRFQFASANSLTLQDVNLGGVITFNRVR